MKPSLITLTLFILTSVTTSFGQAKIEGQVLNDKNQLVSQITIVVTPGGQLGTTDNKGHFTIGLPANVRPGVAAHITIQKPKWVVLDPLFGNCTTQDESINREMLRVVIVPQGSPASMSPRALNALVDGLRKTNFSQGKLIAEQKGKARELELQQEKTAFLQRYADEYGVSPDQLKAVLDEWAQSKEVGDYLERARKAYWRGDSQEVLELTERAWPAAIEESKLQKMQSLQADRKAISTGKYRGLAFYDTENFAKALEVYDQILRLFETDDFSMRALKSEWIEIRTLTGNAKAELGERVEGSKSQQLLKEALTEHQEAVAFYTRDQTPRDWAWAQVNLGNTLTGLGERVRGDEGRGYLNDATTAYRAALVELNRIRISRDLSEREWAQRFWAKTQSNLGLALIRLGERVQGEESRRYLNDAIAACRAALQVVTPKESPQGWALTQLNLASALLMLSRQVDRGDALTYVKSATAGYRAALEVCARDEKLTQCRAQTQQGLGAALGQLGAWTSGQESINYLNEGVAFSRAALQTFNRDEQPQQWARAMVNLGGALMTLGMREGGKGIEHLSEAVRANQLALEVLTGELFPQQWVLIQNNVGYASWLLAEFSAGEERIRHLNEAIAAYRAGLDGGARELAPQQWMIMQRQLAKAYFEVEDWKRAEEAYATVLQFKPDDESYGKAMNLYQHKLFNFEKAFDLNQQLLAQRPDDVLLQTIFAEKHFTTARFSEGVRRINLLLGRPGVPADKIALSAIEIASLLALGQANEMQSKLDSLIAYVSAQPATFYGEWGFDGPIHFIGQNEKLSPYRAWLGQLFEVLGSKDRDTMVKALRDARANFKKKK